MATDIPSFDELLDLLRVRLQLADDLNGGELHSFKVLMADKANVVADGWYWDAFAELQAQGSACAGRTSSLLEGLLTVRQTIVRGRVETPKSHSSKRTIELGPAPWKHFKSSGRTAFTASRRASSSATRRSARRSILPSSLRATCAPRSSGPAS